jgi:hypothetical protein
MRRRIQSFRKSRRFKDACKNRVTLKALASFSPGFCFETLGAKMPGRFIAELRLREMDAFSQGCQSATLGWNWRTLSALFISDESSQEWVSIRLFVQSRMCKFAWKLLTSRRIIKESYYC